MKIGRPPAIFCLSHVSRLDGGTQDVERVFRTVKARHPDSVVLVDGAQSLGVLEPPDVNRVADVYLGMSSKFLGAEPNLGFAFFSDAFYERCGRGYPEIDPQTHDKDLYSLRESLRQPLYGGGYHAWIAGLKDYALARLRDAAPSRVFAPAHQSPGCLTLDFQSKEENRRFVAYAEREGVIVSENANDAWSIIPAPVPLVRVGLSVRTTRADIDRLVEIVATYA